MTNSNSTLIQDPDEYEVEKIHCMQIEKGGGTLTKRGSASRITFLVKWAEHKQKTWEPIESFEDGHGTPGEQHPLIREFLRQGTNLAKYRKMKIAIASESKHVSSVKRFIKREESIHSISNLLDVRLDENGDMEFLVESNGNFESSWQPMSHFPGGEKSNKAILDFLNLERNRRKYEDLKLEVVRIKARKLRKSGNPIPPIPEVQNLPERLQNLLKTWNGFPEKQKEKYVNSKPIGAFDIWKMENEARFSEKFPKKNDKEIGNLLEFEWIFKMENSIKFAYTLDSWDRVMKIEQKGEKRLGKKVFEVPTKIPKMF
ncbi:hypothetical protein L3Y34_019182 [Caenorhabditis briggsae]|uniref:Chromo domain-containing protein n=1 Tax=Caenorhabditis briggsae TaxID=6238 RepID=A0AAE9DP71_CAEBR|nr:hypothetical protein L3Y34_019182 [Caenorhabditis briggsae]